MITIVMPYYENGGMLKRHLTEWAKYAPEVKKQFRAIIVDDGSPEVSAEDAAYCWIASNFSEDHCCGECDLCESCERPRCLHFERGTLSKRVGFPVELYRIKQNIPWNVAGARNLGMDRAPDGWCLLTDIDHLLEKEEAAHLIDVQHYFKPGRFYMLARQWPDGRVLNSHPNSFILERSQYWAIGGCDEDWSGWWGAGEQVFRKSLCASAKKIDLAVRLTHFGRDDIADASTREWGRRDSKWDWKNNPALVEKAARAPYKPENPLRFDWEKLI